MDLKKTVFLKTDIIDKECITRLKKLIFDGPKYLVPLIEGIKALFLAILVKDPE